MSYSQQELEEMTQEVESLARRVDEISDAVFKRRFNNETAMEHARHGLVYRMEIMLHCVHWMFDTLPPERTEVLNGQEESDATIILQAFAINASGCMDNLAIIWVLERNVRGPRRSPLPSARIGLGKKYKEVWKSLPDDLKTILSSNETCLTHLERRSHGLAHRIPLFIMPPQLDADDKEEDRRLGEMIEEAEKRNDFEAVEALAGKKMGLGRFLAEALYPHKRGAHSFWFHRQMLDDFTAIEQLTHCMLPELDGVPSKHRAG